MHENSSDSTHDAAWNRLRPVLEDVMQDLGAHDREAILLRFFEDRSFPEIGATLDLKEDAVRMRVDRAMEKLRGLLARRGITSTSVALATVLMNQTAVAAPAGFAVSVAGNALSQLAAGAIPITALQFMSTAKTV